MGTETGFLSTGPGAPSRGYVVRVGLTLALVLVPGCGGSSKKPDRPAPAELRVAAASDLQRVLPALTDRFTAATGITVTPVVGASGLLAQQIRQGAPFDVFLSANIGYVRDLAAAGHVEADSVRVYARGRLVLVVGKQAKVAVEGLSDLVRPEVKRIAIANPEFAPYGLAARQALEKSGLWEALKPKVVLAETVRQAFQFVEAGNAEVGLVAHSVAQDPEVHTIDVDPVLYEPILQGLCVISGSKRDLDARRFTAFLVGDEGQKLLGSFGFGLPSDNGGK